MNFHYATKFIFRFVSDTILKYFSKSVLSVHYLFKFVQLNSLYIEIIYIEFEEIIDIEILSYKFYNLLIHINTNLVINEQKKCLITFLTFIKYFVKVDYT